MKSVIILSLSLLFLAPKVFATEAFFKKFEYYSNQKNYKKADRLYKLKMKFLFRQKELNCETIIKLIRARARSNFNRSIEYEINKERIKKIYPCFIDEKSGGKASLKDVLIIDGLSELGFYVLADSIYRVIIEGLSKSELNKDLIEIVNRSRPRFFKNNGEYDKGLKAINKNINRTKSQIEKLIALIEKSQILYYKNSPKEALSALNEIENFIVTSKLIVPPINLMYLNLLRLQVYRMNDVDNYREVYNQFRDQVIKSDKKYFGMVFLYFELLFSDIYLSSFEKSEEIIGKINETLKGSSVQGNYSKISKKLETYIDTKDVNVRKKIINSLNQEYKPSAGKKQLLIERGLYLLAKYKNKSKSMNNVKGNSLKK